MINSGVKLKITTPAPLIPFVLFEYWLQRNPIPGASQTFDLMDFYSAKDVYPREWSLWSAFEMGYLNMNPSITCTDIMVKSYTKEELLAFIDDGKTPTPVASTQATQMRTVVPQPTQSAFARPYNQSTTAANAGGLDLVSTGAFGVDW